MSGLVSRVVADNDLDQEVNNVVNAIKKKSRSILALGKSFFYQQLELPLDQAYELAIQVNLITLSFLTSFGNVYKLLLL